MDLFGIKAKKQLKETEKTLKECTQKLMERQEHINKTNAYWKNKVRELKKEIGSNFRKNN